MAKSQCIVHSSIQVAGHRKGMRHIASHNRDEIELWFTDRLCTLVSPSHGDLAREKKHSTTYRTAQSITHQSIGHHQLAFALFLSGPVLDSFHFFCANVAAITYRNYCSSCMCIISTETTKRFGASRICSEFVRFVSNGASFACTSSD